MYALFGFHIYIPWAKQNHRQGCSLRRIQALLCRQTVIGAGTEGPSLGFGRSSGAVSVMVGLPLFWTVVMSLFAWGGILKWSLSFLVFPASGSCVMWWLWLKPWRWKLTGWCWQPAALIFVPCLQVLLLTPDNVWAELAIAVPSPQAVSLSGAAAQAGGFLEREGLQMGLQFAVLDGWCWSSLTDCCGVVVWLWGEQIPCGALWGYCGVWLTGLWVRFFFP